MVGLQVSPGGVVEETELAEWDEHAGSEANWIPSGQECPWRFRGGVWLLRLYNITDSKGLSHKV